MDRSELLPSLNLMTLIGVLLIAIVAFLLFMRKRSNRQAIKHPDDEIIATVRTPDNRS
jgi:LPXTG-motif cell wall-anchored protein